MPHRSGSRSPPRPGSPGGTAAGPPIAGFPERGSSAHSPPKRRTAGTVPSMRALLVVNHKATTTSGRIRDVLVHALRSEVDLEVAYTERRGHAATLAQRAAKDGLDVVVALGGDGTVNEVANGVLSEGPGPSTPAIAVVPGGSTNVFARAIGLPNDW